MAEATKADLTRSKGYVDEPLTARTPTVFLDATNEQMEGLEPGMEVEVTLKGTLKSMNMDDSESDMGRQAARFARRIEGRFGLPVTLVDERLSSREAKANALAAGHRGDFASIPVDDEAAAIILATWLHQQ